ncbi:MAG: Penicillin-binding protein 2 [Microgenomates group bacterium GW2011_GWC2_45_8]|nr:MAG: Penicillin-binding protein 2 [Microgenomates group bacterium GW2011_GWC2_45_8]
MKTDWQEDLLITSQIKRRGYQDLEMKNSRGVRVRVRVVWSVFVVAIAIIVAKTVYLQVVERGQHVLTAETNHVELKREVAPRGAITDRRGEILVRDQATAPIVGYMSEVGEGEVGCRDGLCYQSGMMIGRAGLEQIFESSLRGRDGGRLVETDARGIEVRELGSNQAEAGTDLKLSLDRRLQEIMYSALGGRKGSAVAMDIQGRVLGLVSSPSYDPNKVTDYLNDKENLYFFNRAISGTYAPGSVFKLVTGLSGLAEGKIDKTTQYEDTGEIRVGDYRYGNWYFDQYGAKEGKIDLVRAYARSNDIYFYKVGEEVGVDSLVKWVRRFGLGEKTGIELPGEAAGLVPDRLWKERRTGEKWFLGNTYHLSIGQGDLLVTPLQVARMTLAAVSGRKCSVTLLADKAVACNDLGLKTEDIDLVREGMRQACASGGTAFPFFQFDPYVLCKTGTAQHSGQKTETDLPHAWITVAYPGENPEMILTVMLEAAGEGSAEAGPVAKEILTQWKEIGN